MIVTKEFKNQGIWLFLFLVVCAITFVENDIQSNMAIIPLLGGIVGAVAKGAAGLFSGKGKAARKEAKQAKKDAKAAQKAAELEAKTRQIEAETAATKGKAAGQNIMNIIKQYWWVGLIVVGVFFLLPMLKKKVGSKRGASRSTAKNRAWSRKMLAAKRRKKAVKKRK